MTFAISASAQSVAPRIFFTDLISGPNSGGESVSGFAGAYVTLYGNNFGSSQGTSTVTWNGLSCLRVVSWGTSYMWYQKVVVQLGPACTNGSGNFVVTVGGSASNGVSFTVQAGNIRCVSTTGNDGNAGTFPSSCWAGIRKAATTIAAGDVAYIQNGVTLTGLDNFSSTLWLGDSGSGTAGSLKSLVAYPGATVTIGTPTDQGIGIRGSNFHGANHFWLLAGLTVRAIGAAYDTLAVDGWRVVANDMSCPNGNGQSACFHTDTTTNMQFYGNNVHDVGTTNGAIDKFYHAVYFTTNSNHIDVGWNTVAPNPSGVTTAGGCRAIQFFSTGGSDQFDLHVHDNLVHDSICDGINFATVNADAGVVEAYNNVVYHVGTGPDPSNGAANYSCYNVGSSASRTNAVQLYNNTAYDCGSRRVLDSGGYTLPAKTVMTNNVTQQLSGETYLSQVGGGNLSGSNNEWFGVGNGPTQTTGNVNADPLFVSAPTNLSVRSNSPALKAGTTSHVPVTDFIGAVRPNPPAIGAFEFPAPPALINVSACPNSATSGTPNWPTTPPFEYRCNTAEPTIAGNTLIVAFGTNNGSGPYTVTDQQGDTFVLDTTSSVSNGRALRIFRATNIAAGSTWISVHETTRDNFWQPIVFEVDNAAVLDASSCNVGTSTSLTAGSLTPTVSGDLLLQVVYSSAYNSPPGTNTSFTAGSQSNITWALAHTLLGDGSASQWGVYNSTAAINPTFSSGNSTGFISCAVALRQGATGGASSAFRVYRQEHDSMPKVAPNPWHIGVPVDVAGAVYMAYVGNDQVTGVTSSPAPTGTAWTASGADFQGLNGHNHVNIYCASWTTPPGYVDLSLTRNGNSNDSVNMMYVVIGGTCNLDRDSGGQAANQTTIVSQMTVCTNCLTPTVQNDFIISEGGQFDCTATSLVAPASNAFFSTGWYNGNTVGGPQQVDENNMWAVIRNGASLAPITVTIGETCGGTVEGNWANRLAAYTTVTQSGGTTVTLLPGTLAFPTQVVGSSSASQAVTLANTGGFTLNISSITMTGANPGDFIQSGNCGTTLAAGLNCTINVTFTPVGAGSRTASLSVTSDALNSPNIVTLSGTGALNVLKGSATIFGSGKVNP